MGEFQQVERDVSKVGITHYQHPYVSISLSGQMSDKKFQTFIGGG
jgi:hypothetical protein